MLKFFKEGIKRIMVNIEKMVDEIKNMTVSEAFPLVLCQASVEGYSFLSLILASSVVNRQWTVARC